MKNIFCKMDFELSRNLIFQKSIHIHDKRDGPEKQRKERR